MALQTGDKNGPTSERGSASGAQGAIPWGLWSGGDDIESVPELRWPTSIEVYRKMLNDAQINSLILGATLPIHSYRWYLEPNGASPHVLDRISADYNLPIGKEQAPFNLRRGARRFSFKKHLEDALRALVYGHYFFEQVGEIGDDGKWHLRKLGPRPPRTISEIKVARDGSLEAITQATGPESPPIPVSALVGYVWDREGSNWVGRSTLRSVYRNHLVKDRVLRVGAINIERAGGVPYTNAPEGASADVIKELDAIMRAWRVGEGAGAALPHGAQLKFAAATGSDGAVPYIQLQNDEMAAAFLQMFARLGTGGGGGSYALGQVQYDYFQLAQEHIAGWFADVFTEHVIEDDVEWNEGPDEEYTPLLRFETANAMEPTEGFDAALGEDDGLMITEETEAGVEARAMLGRRRTRRPVAARQTAPGSSGTGGQAGQRATGAAGQASPVPLPPRPLRRAPYEHEVRAATDFAALDSAYDSATDLLMQEVRALQGYQIDALHDAIIDAGDDLEELSELSVDPEHRDVIHARLVQTATIAVGQAIDEAGRQGVVVPRQNVEDITDALRARADAVDRLLVANLAQTASRHAVRLTGGSLTPAEVADATRDYLRGLSGTYLRDVLGGAVQQSINAGRKLVFGRDESDGDVYASELLDANTCSRCVAVDGTPYDTLAAAERDYPTGGYKDCEGRERCRGTLVKVYKSEVPSTLEDNYGL